MRKVLAESGGGGGGNKSKTVTGFRKLTNALKSAAKGRAQRLSAARKSR